MPDPTPRPPTPSLAWGLNLAEPDITSQAEIDEFRRVASTTLGGQDGLDFWLDTRPDVLKRYRNWVNKFRVRGPGDPPNLFNANLPGTMVTYASTGFEDGLRYNLLALHRILTEEQLSEVMALAFRYSGPRGMAAIAKAARAQAWPEMVQPAAFPNGWGPDPDAYKSGADFRAPGASADDIRKIVGWYERVLGEVPGHVQLLACHHPELLKATRDRYENTLRVLPKQLDPYLLIQMSVHRGFADGIREGVLLARGFGMTKPQVIEAMNWGTFYSGTEALNLAHRAAGDVLDAW